jgi:hypothetical protein
VCFEGPAPAELRPGVDGAAAHLRFARWLSPGAVRRLPVLRGRIQLGEAARDACVSYGVELTESGYMDSAVRRFGPNVLASPNVWLWRPERRTKDATATLHIELPEGVQAAVPWPRQGSRYVLGPEVFRFHAHAAFGPFEPLLETHAGVEIQIANLADSLHVDAQGLRRWLRAAVDLSALGPGGSPSSRLQVILAPVSRAMEPVPFGTVARGGDASMVLFVAEQATETQLVRDWVLPHELSHLFVPYVAREHAWFSEGVASYYQEVLRARAGILTESEALQNLARAMRSAAGEGTGRTLAEESRDMHATHAYRPVYWGGAAYFLIADVRLRQETKGAQSLDEVLGALRRDEEQESWSLPALLARMDDLAGRSLFVPLAAASLNRRFPDFEPTLNALGVEGDALRDDAPLAGLRAAIFGRRSPPLPPPAASGAR